ncbi:hypothetical protein Sjap_003185 [Stephania japonica]|uniref:3'-5' exonuclease domain-containing protein n=1 Tax=Stephania japonica TaxID=461633 RepID=A0AAP0KP67_9MAGN
MEAKQKLKLTLAFASLTVISIIAATHLLRRRNRRNKSPKLCYLDSETKPQSGFKRVLAENSYTPFKHLKRRKEAETESSANSHPYEEEIAGLVRVSGIESVEFGGDLVDLGVNGGFVWVETEEQLKELEEVLRKKRVFAVDTEQHSLRSFLGFTALMQISTQEEDYLVDTIALHDVMGLLRHVFADPGICKVFHGADNDIIWLQRDFHIYVVNLFDTAKACEVLSKPQKSLAYLLETYCNVSSNKLLQREDWRQRPLSGEMVQYACADAHYLLYIADCLASELKKQCSGFDGEERKEEDASKKMKRFEKRRMEPSVGLRVMLQPVPDNNSISETSACLDDKFNFLLEASRRSNMTCLQLYTKDIEAFPGNSAASSILSRNFNSEAGSPVTSETKARFHDESLRFVVSDQAIFALASVVPKTEAEIYDTISKADVDVNSLSVRSSLLSPSPVVYSHVEDLIYLLLDGGCKSNDVLVDIVQKHLDSNGTCPLSIYNYVLLCKFNLKAQNSLSVKPNVVKAVKYLGRKVSRELFVQKFSCKSPVYHNCRIYANDGRLLCYCDRRKLEWYVRRDLAKIVDNDPPAIMLLFEPKGRPEDEDNDFYIQSKKNICVGCGEGNHYLRYRIIPSCYRIHFPEHLKSHRSHDIVLLCVDCHEIAHAAAEKHKREIAAKFGIPLFVKSVVDSGHSQVSSDTSVSVENLEEQGVSPLQLRTAAMALIRHGPRMPTKRYEELMQVVMKYFGKEEILKEDLEKALLVGMSPHEKRRLEKKRGLLFKHHSENTFEKNEAKTNGLHTPAFTDKSKENDVDVVSTTVEKKFSELEGSVRLLNGDGVINSSTCFDVKDNGGNSLSYGNKKSIVGGGNAMDTDEDHETKGISLPRATDNSCDLVSNGTPSPKYNKKLSLLGHGPHGKQIVNHLLKEYGENGIHDFCQTWRLVFVEVIHPRFLPAGWDVKHRYGIL